MLESGRFDSVRELAKAEKINESYLGRTLRLTLLSPELTDAILDGRHPEGLSLEQLLRGMPTVWKEQSPKTRCTASSDLQSPRQAS